MRKIILATAALAALTGCKTQIATDLFTSDLIAAANGATLTAPLTIGLETGSEAECTKNAPAILTAVQSKFTEAEFIGCATESFDHFARFRVQATVTQASSAPGAPFAIGATRDGAALHITYLTDPAAVRAIWNALPKDMTEYKRFEFKPILTATINNDLPGDVTLTTDDVFANGQPVQGTRQHSLARRAQIDIALSDVTNAAFEGDGTAHIATIDLPE